MKISTRGRYALRVVIDLATQNSNDFIPLRDIAQRQEISMKYLEQIMRMLNKADIVESYRGKQGGYKLKKTPSEITAFDVLSASEGNFKCVSCIENSSNCSRCSECYTIHFWEELSSVIIDYLKTHKIQYIIQTSDTKNKII